MQAGRVQLATASCPITMTSIEDQVKELHNQTCALYNQLMKHLGPSTPKGQAEQNAMSDFFKDTEPANPSVSLQHEKTIFDLQNSPKWSQWEFQCSPDDWWWY